MPRKKIEVSVLIPSYNNEKYLNKAVHSILNQDFKNFEIIIIDDCSTDNSYKLAKKLRREYKQIKVFKQRKNYGRAVALNRGIEKSKGNFIVFLDADDLMYPERLSKQVKFFKDNPETEVVYGDMVIFWEKENKKELYKAPSLENPKEILESIQKSPENVNELAKEYSGLSQIINKEKYLPGCSVMIRKKVFEKGVKFDQKFEIAQDYDLWFQMFGKEIKISKMDIITYIYRRHPSQITLKKKEKRKKMIILALKKIKAGIYFK